MESRVPLPTDNIFKFYALFGLLLFIFSCGSMLYSVRSANEAIFDVVPELQELKQIEKPTPSETIKISLLERKLEITKADKNLIANALSYIAAIGILLMGFGFIVWHRKVQPVADRMAEAQTQIAELQLEKLRKELDVVVSAPKSVSPSSKSAKRKNNN